MNKKNIIFLLLLLCCFTFIGCKPTKSANDIAKDIIKHELDFDLYKLSFKSAEINKRQTNKNQKTDYIWITVTSENDEFTYVGKYKAEYVLYNSGWEIEDYDVLSTEIIPNSEPSEDEIKDAMSDYKNWEIVDKEKGDLSITYSLTATSKTEYDLSCEDTVILDFTYNLSSKKWTFKNLSAETVNSTPKLMGEWISDGLCYLHVKEVSDDNIIVKYSLLDLSCGSIAYVDDYVTLKLHKKSQSVYYFLLEGNENLDIEEYPHAGVYFYVGKNNAELAHNYGAFINETKMEHENSYPKMKKENEERYFNNDIISAINSVTEEDLNNARKQIEGLRDVIGITVEELEKTRNIYHDDKLSNKIYDQRSLIYSAAGSVFEDGNLFGIDGTFAYVKEDSAITNIDIVEIIFFWKNEDEDFTDRFIALTYLNKLYSNDFKTYKYRNSDVILSHEWENLTNIKPYYQVKLENNTLNLISIYFRK